MRTKVGESFGNKTVTFTAKVTMCSKKLFCYFGAHTFDRSKCIVMGPVSGSGWRTSLTDTCSLCGHSEHVTTRRSTESEIRWARSSTSKPPPPWYHRDKRPASEYI